MMHEVRSSLVLVSMLRRQRLRRATHNMNVMMQMKQQQQQRWMVGRASNRSGVHGSHLPPTHSLDDVEGVQKEIIKGMKDKESKRKRVEDTVDSHLKNSGQDTKASSN